MTAGHKINQETTKVKESEKVEAIKYIQVGLLYKYLITTSLKKNLLAHSRYLNLQNEKSMKGSL